MFDEPKMNINVNMSGKEYMEYKNKKKLSKKAREALPYFFFVGLGLVVLVFLIVNLTEKPYTRMSYLENSLSIVRGLSGLEIFKLGLVMAFPFVIISWILHGVQLRILA